MTNAEISWIKSLDPEKINGTIQSVLMQENVDTLSFVNVVMLLLMSTLQENEFLRKQNIELSQGMFNAAQ